MFMGLFKNRVPRSFKYQSGMSWRRTRTSLYCCESTSAIAYHGRTISTISPVAFDPSCLIICNSYGSDRRTSCPRIQKRTAAIPMMLIDAQSEASIPWRNASETPGHVSDYPEGFLPVPAPFLLVPVRGFPVSRGEPPEVAEY
jgi:hypothetical protein